MQYTIRPMTIDDYGLAYRLWEQAEGLCLEDGDQREAIEIYLKRNEGLCYVACVGDEIVGTVLCGHDGRRGILRHLVVRRDFQRQGIARDLIGICLSALAKMGITKCNTFVMDDNLQGRQFWDYLGWRLIDYDYRTLQIDTSPAGQDSLTSPCPGRRTRRQTP